MANINLYQTIQDEHNVSQKKSLMERGFLLVILLLVFSLAVWGGLKGYNMLLNKKISSLESQILSESNRIESAKIDRVADFQERLDVIKTSLPSRKDPTEFFSNLEKVMVPGVILESCDFSYGGQIAKSTANLKANADSYTLLAEQVLNLKKSDYFKNVQLGTIARNQDGKIGFSVTTEFGK